MSKYRNLKTYHECSKCFREFPEGDQQEFMMPIMKRKPRTLMYESYQPTVNVGLTSTPLWRTTYKSISRTILSYLVFFCLS